MRRDPYRPVALIHRVLAYTFAAVGLIFLIAPNGTVGVINAAGAWFRVFPPAPQSDLRFWLSLAAAYMALVTALAWQIANDPRGRRALMPLLALGKSVSSLTCLLYFVFDRPTFLYFLNFLTDGSIAVTVLGCYAWLGILHGAAATAREPDARVAELLSLVTRTLVADGAGGESSRAPAHLEQTVWEYFRGLHPLGTTGLTVILYVLEFGPLLFGPRRRRFSRLTAPEREACLAAWESAGFAPRRQLLNGLKLAVMLHYYDLPDVAAAIGFDGGYVRDKLLAGPNAQFHRQRFA